MNIYLAARYSRRAEMLVYRTQLEAIGHIVTSRWINGSHQLDTSGTPIGDHGEHLVESGDCREAARLRQRFCEEDLADVLSCDCLISFTEEPRQPTTNRGGRHVELGIAIGQAAAGKDRRLITVGWRENIFHWLPQVEFYETWVDARAALEGRYAVKEPR
jgi:hypothetical protein